MGLVAVVVGWGLITTFVMTASRLWLSEVDQSIRRSVIVRSLLPSDVLVLNPWWIDIAYHLAFYGPFGFFAVVAGRLARRWWPMSADRVELRTRVSCFVAAACFALLDEIRQIPLPDRSADAKDFVAGCAGIMLGGLVCSIMHWVFRTLHPSQPPVEGGTIS